MKLAVVAKTKARAKAVIEEFGLDAIAIANNENSARGLVLKAVIVDDSALPLKPDVEATLSLASGGNICALVWL